MNLNGKLPAGKRSRNFFVESQRLLEIKVQERTRELEFSEGRFRDFAETSADWFWEQDKELKFNFITAPDKTRELVSLNNILGKTRFETGVVNLSSEQANKHLDALEKREPFSKLHLARKLKSGDIYHVEINGIPLFDSDGEFVGYRGTGRDITDIINAEKEMTSERDRANNANKAKSSFLAHMSHELRTPLNAIIGFSSIMHSEIFGPLSNPKYSDYINDIHNSGNYLLELINDILDLTVIESGESKLHKEECDLISILNRCLRMCDTRLGEKSMKIKVNPPKETICLIADRRMIMQVFLNILSNSIKYGNVSGIIQISFSVKQDIEIEVFDDGIGISEDRIKTVFEPFRRVEDDVLRPAEGVGLGLPISQKFMQLHGGGISISSKEHLRATIPLHFPRISSMVQTVIISQILFFVEQALFFCSIVSTVLF